MIHKGYKFIILFIESYRSIKDFFKIHILIYQAFQKDVLQDRTLI
ncbi:hypothetical protein RIEPE_0287 [Candidatus Riesia pediculicola USDA]|uniref:Uncharacterized protein n=1 Tax=Riesia pediculicola (strain USDA) TaxID=515618 RepID=D4G882_RIEPU|nr:hypothetical protein RIEPE_0287 [Candidatus Riesia pediculicola USDA]